MNAKEHALKHYILFFIISGGGVWWSHEIRNWIYFLNPLLRPLLNIIQYGAYIINQITSIGYLTGCVGLLRIVIFVLR